MEFLPSGAWFDQADADSALRIEKGNPWWLTLRQTTRRRERDDLAALDFSAADDARPSPTSMPWATTDEPEEARRRTSGAAVHRHQSARDGDGHGVHGRPRQADRSIAEGNHDDGNGSRRGDRRHRRPGHQDARSAQYAFMLEGMRQQGHDDVTTRDFLARDLDLPTPEEANAARAQLFATRYAGGHD